MSRPSGVLHAQLDGWRTVCGRPLQGKTDAPIRVAGDPARVTCQRCRRSRKVLRAYGGPGETPGGGVGC